MGEVLTGPRTIVFLIVDGVLRMNSGGVGRPVRGSVWLSKPTRLMGEDVLLLLLRRELLRDVGNVDDSEYIGCSIIVALQMAEFKAFLTPWRLVVLIGPGAAFRRPLLRLLAAITSLGVCQCGRKVTEESDVRWCPSAMCRGTKWEEIQAELCLFVHAWSR